MNRAIIMGRLTRDPEVSEKGDTRYCRYTLAVDRRGQNREADFINVVAFGKAADFADKYFAKGQRVLVSGRIQTGSYKNRDGQTVRTFDIIAEDQEFADSKQEAAKPAPKTDADGFQQLPDLDDEGLPFN